MNRVSRILAEAIQALRKLNHESEEFKRGYWMCWLFITKNIQKRITGTQIKESENLHYKIKCLQDDLRLSEERNRSLKESNKVFRDYFNEHNKKVSKS